MDKRDLFVVIRAAGERTIEVCREEMIRQTSQGQVVVVSQTPFWRTLREGLEIGRQSGQPWILSVDADVIPSEEAVRCSVEWANQAEANVAVVTGMIMDKLLSCIRFGGIRLYRASIINEVLNLLPLEGESVRPESKALGRLNERGWRHKTATDLVGYHDFEQYYRDIYRKAFLHLIKHGDNFVRMLELWRREAKNDPDFQAALAGAANALLWRGDLECDASHHAFHSEAMLERCGLTEKPPLSFDHRRMADELERFRKTLDSGSAAPHSREQQELFDRTQSEEESMLRIERMSENLKFISNMSHTLQLALANRIRWMLPDDLVLNRYGIGELSRHTAGRIWRAFRKSNSRKK